MEFGTLNQTHYRRAALARTQRLGEQPVVSSDGNRSNLVELGLKAVADEYGPISW
jgi:phosphopantothenate synthetase